MNKKQATDLSHLTTESSNQATRNIDECSPIEIVRLMSSEDARVAAAVAAAAEPISRAMELITDRLRQGGRLVYIGAGTSGRLGVLDASECPPTFNTPPELVVGVIAGGNSALTRSIEGAEDHPQLGEQDLANLQLSAQDAVVGIATSGRTPYVIGALRYAQSVQALTVGLCCNADSELANVAEILIPVVVGAEVITGSTRLKAGTATKMVLNMLTTGTMVLLGKTYGNLMVDLRATNDKLTQRAKRLVGQLTDLSADESEALLARCEGELKTAVVVHRAGVSPDDARKLLDECGGQLRRAVGAAGDRNLAEKSARELVAGVDGGGSSTTAWLADKATGEVLGQGAAGPSNIQSVGLANACDNIDAAIRMAFSDAKMPRQPVVTCLALAGSDRPGDKLQLENWLSKSPWFAEYRIVNDALPVLVAGTTAGHGVALISGTGSLAFGRDSRGETARSGGWGYLIGDEGSGYAIALAGLRCAVQSADGRGPATVLLDRFLQHEGVTSAAQLVPLLYQTDLDRSEIAQRASVVFDACDQGDEVALSILRSAARDLSDMVCAVADKLNLEKAELVFAGGVLAHQEQLRRAVLDELANSRFQVAQTGVVAEPVQGSLQLAQEL